MNTTLTVTVALLLFIAVYLKIDIKFIFDQILLHLSTSEHYKRKRKDLRGLSERDRHNDL